MSQLTLPATAPAMPVMRGARVIHDIVINADTATRIVCKHLGGKQLKCMLNKYVRASFVHEICRCAYNI